MGTDIHGPWVEQVRFYQSGGVPFWELVAKLNWNRDYRLFDILAGARGAAVIPKGHPWGANKVGAALTTEEASWDYIDHCSNENGVFTYGDCHDASWNTVEELYAAQEQLSRYGRASGDLDLAITIMLKRTVLQEDPLPCRIVYCFDN